VCHTVSCEPGRPHRQTAPISFLDLRPDGCIIRRVNDWQSPPAHCCSRGAACERSVTTCRILKSSVPTTTWRCSLRSRASAPHLWIRCTYASFLDLYASFRGLRFVVGKHATPPFWRLASQRCSHTMRVPRAALLTLRERARCAAQPRGFETRGCFETVQGSMLVPRAAGMVARVELDVECKAMAESLGHMAKSHHRVLGSRMSQCVPATVEAGAQILVRRAHIGHSTQVDYRAHIPLTLGTPPLHIGHYTLGTTHWALHIGHSTQALKQTCK
jgi:hypothetical protein